MSRQLEARAEERETKRRLGILKAVDGGLEEAVGRAGGVLTGLAVKFSGADCLVVVKAQFPAAPMVAFVGAADFGEALVKAAREAASDKLKWRPDQYAGPVKLDEG